MKFTIFIWLYMRIVYVNGENICTSYSDYIKFVMQNTVMTA